MRWQSLVTGPALACAIGSLASPLPADPQPAATIRAAGRGAPYLFLRDGQKIVTNYVGGAPPGQSRPLTLASADFDEDGMPDLVSGYAAADGTGVLSVHRGNVDALWPYGKAIRNGEPPAFHPDARVFTLPEAPDVLGPATSMQTATGTSWRRTLAVSRSTFCGAMGMADSPKPSASTCPAR